MIIEAQHYGLHPDDIDFVTASLRKGKVGIVPTDAVYVFCGLADQKSAFETICRLKRLDPREAMMSMVCRDLSQASEFFTQWETPTYRLLNKNLPGPFTFILQAGNKAPAFLKNKRKTLGLRIPEHAVIHSIMQQLDFPLIVGTVISDDEWNEYPTDPDQLIRNYEKQVGFIVMDENSLRDASTVVDLTSGEPVILRQSRHELKT